MIFRFGLILAIIVCCFLLSTKISYKFMKIINLICCIILSIMAYHLEPLKSLDIYRYYTHIDIAQQNGLFFIFNHNDYSTLPVAGLYISIFALLKNKFLLPMVTCFCYYFFISNIVIDYSQKNNKSKIGTMIFLILFYTVSNYLGVISGIRNPMAISLFSYVLYKDLIMNSNFKKCLVVYVLLCMFHPSVLIMLIIRLFLILNRKFDKIICAFLLLWTSLKNLLISFLLKISTNEYLVLISKKLIAYDENEANAVANVSLYTTIYFLFYISCIVLFILYRKCTKREEDDKSILFSRYYKYSLCFCIGSITEYHMFVRFSRSALMLLAIPFINIISNKKISNGNKMLIIFFALSESILFLIFFLTGQYSSIKFN